MEDELFTSTTMNTGEGKKRIQHTKKHFFALCDGEGLSTAALDLQRTGLLFS